MKRHIVVFDFDGTITRRDSFIEFAKYACGNRRTIEVLLRNAPRLMAMRMQLLDNGKLKEQIFASLFKGIYYDEFKQKGVSFAEKIDTFVRAEIVEIINNHIKNGDTVYVCSASIEEWVKPWCRIHSINNIIATKAEIKNGLITGRFETPNCYGQEKVRRFFEYEPKREDYLLTVYGDSRGDNKLMSIADYKHWI